MEIEFRVDKIPNCMELFKKLRAKAYRILICYENKDKNGKACKEHYHGYAECDTRIKHPEDAMRSLIKRYCTDKVQYMVRRMKNDTLTALAYCFKQNQPVIEYNISYDYDRMADRWTQMKQEYLKLKDEKEKYKDVVSDFVLQECLKSQKLSLDEIKMIVCKKMVADKKLPVMGKVRSYTLYAILTNTIQIPEQDLYKLC